MTRALALLLTVLTGFAGLVYEVTWQKYLGTLLGSQSEATAAVLGLFLGGLSVGYTLFGRVTQRWVEAGRSARLLAFYGGVEGAIGVYAFAFPWLFRAAQQLSLGIPYGHAGAAFAFDVALAALLIGPPTILMGATIPVLTQALARSLAEATRIHALVYGLNTAGAFAGALAAGFWLVPRLGLDGALAAMGTLNISAGALYLALGARRRTALASPSAQPAGVRSPAIPGLPVYAAVAFLTGFAMMTLQTILIRIGGLSFGSSHFTFAMVVAVFVLSIALGSLAVSGFAQLAPRLLVANQWALVLLLAALYLELDTAPYWAHLVRALFRDEPLSFYAYHFVAFFALLLVIGPPVTLGGAVLPLLFHRLRREVGDLGATAGRLYSWNTLGSLVGALLGGYALLFWMDLHAVYRVAVAALAVSAALLAGRAAGSWERASAAFVVPALAALVLLAPWSPAWLSSGLFRTRAPIAETYQGPAALLAHQTERKLLRYHKDDPVSTVAVIEFGDAWGRVSRAIVNNGKPDGSLIHDYATTALLGLLPALLAERAERAFVIGFGTGVTTGELAALPSMRHVDVAEIASGVIDAAPLFEAGNLRAASNPKVTLIRGDAYRALLRSRERFDVICSEPSNPWVTGVEMLYSLEFLSAARERLGPGGVFAQWIHSYETDDATIELVLRTYAAAFDQVAVWYGLGHDLLLLGFAAPPPDPDRLLDRLAARAALPEFAAALRRSEIADLPTLLAHEVLPLGVVHAAALPGPVHTLLHPRLSDLAARAFFVGHEGHLPATASLAAARAGAHSSLLRRWAARHGGALSSAEEVAVLREQCRHQRPECVAWLARVRIAHPDAEALVEELARQQTGEGGLPLAAQLLDEVASFEPGGTPAPAGAVDLAAAAHATEVFRSYYHHAVPFRRAALEAIWRACESHDPTRCARPHAEAERALGDLGVEADGLPAAARR